MNRIPTPKCVPIPLTSGKVAYIFAGPTCDRLPGYGLIRLAREIEVPVSEVAFDIATSDFQPLTPELVEKSIGPILDALERGDRLYVGCMGGTGRTGTLLALLVAQHPAFDGTTAINYIRQVYKPGAVETAEQKKQVHGYAGQWSVKQSERPELRANPANGPYAREARDVMHDVSLGIESGFKNLRNRLADFIRG